MNKQEIISAINDYIKSNGVQEITGQVMNLILKSITDIIPEDTMLTSSFGGIVKPADLITITPGLSRWFIAKAGNYPNNGGFTFEAKNLNILSYDGAEWDENQIELPTGATVVDGFVSTSINNSGSAKNDKLLHDSIKTLTFTNQGGTEATVPYLSSENWGTVSSFSDVNGSVTQNGAGSLHSGRALIFDTDIVEFTFSNDWIVFGKRTNGAYVAFSLTNGSTEGQIAQIDSNGNAIILFSGQPFNQTVNTSKPFRIVFDANYFSIYNDNVLIYQNTKTSVGWASKAFGVSEGYNYSLNYTYKFIKIVPNGISVEGMVLGETENLGRKIVFENSIVKLKKLPFAGKKVVAYGDSITVSYDSISYENQLKLKLGTPNVVRKGESGQSFTGNLQNNSNVNSLVAEKADLVILHSVNDHRSGANIGSMADVEGTASLFGGLKKICNALISDNKNIEIILCLPLLYGVVSGYPNTGSNDAIGGKFLHQYCDAFIEFARCYGIRIVDLSSNCGFRPQVEGTANRVFTSDGVHPNPLGYAVMTDLIAETINNL